jgi:hypothetical protein
MFSTIGQKGSLLILDDYVRAFKQSTLYFYFKQGGRLDQGFDKSELLLQKTTQFEDPKQLVDAILKYSPRLACTIRIAHMEGEEIFGKPANGR